jgi:hypothetical protein
MNAQQDKPAEKEDPNKAFYEKSHRAIRDLFDKAKVANELHFVMGMTLRRWWPQTMAALQGTVERVGGCRTARPHLLRISGTRKSVVTVAVRPTQCPLCPHSDQVPQRSEMTPPIILVSPSVAVTL